MPTTYEVVVQNRTLADFQREIEGLGRRALPLELDVRDYDSIQRMAEAAESYFGRLDILVNNAGCNIRKPALEVTWDDWSYVVDTNLRGTFFVAQAVARRMIPPGSGARATPTVTRPPDACRRAFRPPDPRRTRAACTRSGGT